MHDVDFNAVTVRALKASAYEVAYIAQQSELDAGLCGNGGENPYKGSHLPGVMHEEIGVSSHSMAEVYTGKSCAAT